MNRHKSLLIASVSAIVLTAVGMYFSVQNKCECVKFQKIDQVIINKDLTVERTTDSICVMGGNRRGQLILKKVR